MLRAGGHSTSVVSGGRRKVHTTFEDGGEMVEEYDMKTSELIGAGPPPPRPAPRPGPPAAAPPPKRAGRADRAVLAALWCCGGADGT